MLREQLEQIAHIHRAVGVEIELRVVRAPCRDEPGHGERIGVGGAGIRHGRHRRRLLGYRRGGPAGAWCGRRLAAEEREQVLHVARLAKLALSPEEEERFCERVARILEYVELLEEIDETAEELTHVVVHEKEPREDAPAPCLPREEVLALAPAADGETMRVPPVIDGGGEA